MGTLYLVVTVLLFIFKTEKSSFEIDELPQSSAETYQNLYHLLKLDAIVSLAITMVVSKVAFAVHDNVTALKLLEKGFPKEQLAFMSLIQLPFEIVGTIVVGRWSSGHRPLSPYLIGVQLRIVLCIIAAFFVYIYPSEFQSLHGEIPLWYYGSVLILSILYQFASDGLMFVSIGAFFARISDNSIGGTYLTLLNTISNLGGIWPKFFVLALTDKLTIREDCGKEQCAILIDGYYSAALIALPVGILLSIFISRRLRKLETVHADCWKLKKSTDLEKCRA
mmetsp:Transcript_4955/g.8599  ORF Transcript_4955/g.8599 Transcript_4955/m.8599 type:complete len:279 (+) Transcript_4955:1-837(+)